MRVEELCRDCVNCAVRLRGEARRKAWELEVRKGQPVERMNARRTGRRERNRERRGVDEDETEAADCNGNASDALGAQRHQPELVPN
jgi:hypothetical protein